MSIVTWPGPDTPREHLAPGQGSIEMCEWIAHALTFGLNHGWRPTKPVTSGYRPGRDPHTSSGVSNHQATDFNGGVTPCGAIDFGGFTDPEGYKTKMALIAILHQHHYEGHMLVAPIGFHDDGHCSGNGH